MSNKGTSYENPYRDKNRIFRRERKSSLKRGLEKEKTDCFELTKNSHRKDTSIGSTPKHKIDNEYLDIHENKRSVNENEKLWVY